MTKVARRVRPVVTALGLLAALAVSSTGVAQTQGGATQNNGATGSASSSSNAGDCRDSNTATYDALYHTTGVVMTQEQAAAATGRGEVWRCAGCPPPAPGQPFMEMCWLKNGSAQTDASSTGGASDSGGQDFSSPYGPAGGTPSSGGPNGAPGFSSPYGGPAGATPSSGGPSGGSNPTPVTPTGQPPAPTPAQPPVQWNGQPPTCTNGGWNVGTCTFTDKRGQKWTGPQNVQCNIVNINLQHLAPFRAQYQLGPTSLNNLQVTGNSSLETVRVTLFRTYSYGNPAPPDTITVPFYKGTSTAGMPDRQTLCPRDEYTQPYTPPNY